MEQIISVIDLNIKKNADLSKPPTLKSLTSFPLDSGCMFTTITLFSKVYLPLIEFYTVISVALYCTQRCFLTVCIIRLYYGSQVHTVHWWMGVVPHSCQFWLCVLSWCLLHNWFPAESEAEFPEINVNFTFLFSTIFCGDLKKCLENMLEMYKPKHFHVSRKSLERPWEF